MYTFEYIKEARGGKILPYKKNTKIGHKYEDINIIMQQKCIFPFYYVIHLTVEQIYLDPLKGPRP